jgi:hypothetical protein
MLSDTKLQVINLYNRCIWLVNLFESCKHFSLLLIATNPAQESKAYAFEMFSSLADSLTSDFQVPFGYITPSHFSNHREKL